MINPENIHCLALNFKGVGIDHEEPLYFVKAMSSLCYSGSVVSYPKNSHKMWTEVELGIIVAHDCKNICIEDAEKYIAGYTVCADITCENLYNRDHHLAFSKSRMNFCPVNNKIVEIPFSSLPNLSLVTQINGITTQLGYMKDVKYDVQRSLSYISSITALKKGDLILLGTPKGVENNQLFPGDHVRHVIDNIGKLEYSIV